MNKNILMKGFKVLFLIIIIVFVWFVFNLTHEPKVVIPKIPHADKIEVDSITGQQLKVITNSSEIEKFIDYFQNDRDNWDPGDSILDMPEPIISANLYDRQNLVYEIGASGETLFAKPDSSHGYMKTMSSKDTSYFCRLLKINPDLLEHY